MKDLSSFAVWLLALPALTYAVAVERRHTTLTIPYFGACKTTITLHPCSGSSKVVVETPFPKPICPSNNQLPVSPPHYIPSTTIPYLGSTTTTTTVTICPGTASIIVETPLGLPSCTSKSPSKSTPSSSRKSSALSSSRTSSSSRITSTTASSTRSSTPSSASSSKTSTSSLLVTSSSSSLSGTPSSTTTSSSLSTAPVISSSSSIQTTISTSSTDVPNSIPSSPPTIVVSSTDSSFISSTSSASPKSSSVAVGSAGACSVPQINPACFQSGGQSLEVAYYTNPWYTAGYSHPDSPLKSNYYLQEDLYPLITGADTTISFTENNDMNNYEVITPPSVNGINYWQDWTRPVGGGIIVDANNFTVVYQGYYRAPATDTFKMCAESDNEMDVYFGDSVGFDCLDGAINPDNSSPSFQGYLNQPGCRTFDLVAGAFYPIRAVVGNNQGPSSARFSVQQGSAPAITDLSGLVFPTSCLASN